ncbi:MAG: hypothetical protein PHV74_12750 [Dehalococcoidia bacterium]|nr:hypothetical protein [Dehalococcoidia bacterium]
MDIIRRIEKLEQKTPEPEKPPACIFYLHGNTSEETEANREKAIAAYRVENPEWVPSDRDRFFEVANPETEGLMRQLLIGEMPL